MDPRFALAGLVVGTLVGMFGIGGGSLLAPILILLFGVKASLAIGTDLLYSVPMKAVAAYAHARQGTLDRRLIAALATGGIPGALLGIAAFGALRTHVGQRELDDMLRHAIGIVILLSALASLAVWLTPHRPRPGERPHFAVSALVGLGVGFVVALTSIGSGAITLPLLLLTARVLPLRALIGSEIVYAAIMIPIAAAGHVAYGNVDFGMAISIAIGALPGAYIGARLCTRVGEGALRPAIIGLLAFAGVRLL
ncbi:MAG: sulfite exporter TauE/SafE family protein [Candidatus Velthaea sp.]